MGSTQIPELFRGPSSFLDKIAWARKSQIPRLLGKGHGHTDLNCGADRSAIGLTSEILTDTPEWGAFTVWDSAHHISVILQNYI